MKNKREVKNKCDILELELVLEWWVWVSFVRISCHKYGEEQQLVGAAEAGKQPQELGIKMSFNN